MRLQTRLLTLLLLVLVAQAAWSDDFRVKDIRVEGLQRITAGTVFNYLPIQPGDMVTDQNTGKLIRALYATGFFKDVRLERDGNVLIVVVQERPAIAKIKISGNKSIDTKQLLSGLKDAGLAEGRTFNQSVLSSIETELQRQYFNEGKYGVKIKTTVTPLERNRVAINIDIVEGRTALIKKINVIGNKVFSEKKLLSQFTLSTGSWFSWFNKNNQYSRQKLAGDLERLRSFYLNRGYVRFKIDSTQVTITPDKTGIFITVNISEGKRYTISNIQLAGDYIGPAKDYFPLIHLRRGEAFNRDLVVKSTDRISAKLSEQGYAFANVNAIPEVDDATHTVAITYFVDPGKRVYVRRINIKGNTQTRDEVIRREFRQMEAALFSSEKLKLSRERAQRTGYFEKVNVQTPSVPGSGDQVDVNVDVREKPSGALLAGIGFSQADGLILNASINQSNFLGSGKKVGLALQTSQASKHYEVSYTNPYYTVDGISRGFTLSYQSTDFSQLNIANYKTNDLIAGVSYGIPLSEFNRLNFGFNVHKIDLTEGSAASSQVQSFVDANGSNYLDFEASLGWSRDTRDSAIFPNSGSLQQVSAQVTVPGSNLEYYRLSYSNHHYWPIFGKLVLSLNGDFGYGSSYGKTSELPLFENFFAGGPTSIRGFAALSVGPHDSNNQALGGNAKVVGNLELLLPAPYYPDSMRLLAFVDGGTVFNTLNGGFSSNELRYSTGIGMAWLSPVGAITLSFAKPFNVGPYDTTEQFQFTLGTAF